MGHQKNRVVLFTRRQLLHYSTAVATCSTVVEWNSKALSCTINNLSPISGLWLAECLCGEEGGACVQGVKSADRLLYRVLLWRGLFSPTPHSHSCSTSLQFKFGSLEEATTNLGTWPRGGRIVRHGAARRARETAPTSARNLRVTLTFRTAAPSPVPAGVPTPATLTEPAQGRGEGLCFTGNRPERLEDESSTTRRK